MMDSWIAQASTLGCVEEEELCLISECLLTNKQLLTNEVYLDTTFTLCVYPKMYDSSFCLCDTFMCEDPHMLSLSISAPSIDYQTNKVFYPVFMWYDMGLEMSLVEVEEVFGVTVHIVGTSEKLLTAKKMLTTIPELNTNYGFDLTHGGVDVCKYFRWPLMEILDISTGGRKICIHCVYGGW